MQVRPQLLAQVRAYARLNCIITADEALCSGSDTLRSA
jgi:hypothetical protein